MEKNKNINKNIELSKIDVMPNFNARQDFGDLEELANQIKENGLLEAISVIPYMKDGEERYMLVNGERRYRAMKLLDERGEGLESVPARMLEVDDSDSEGLTDEEKAERAKAIQADMFVQQYVRNASKPFTDYETALLFHRLHKSGMNKSEIAKALGKNPGAVTYYLRIFEWDPRITEMIANGKIGIMNCDRVYKACKAKYGKEEFEEKFTEEILGLNSIKDSLTYSYAKDTKDFKAGMRVLKQYFSEYSKMVPGRQIPFNLPEVYERLKKDDSLTLKDIFEEAVKKMKSAM